MAVRSGELRRAAKGEARDSEGNHQPRGRDARGVADWAKTHVGQDTPKQYEWYGQKRAEHSGLILAREFKPLRVTVGSRGTAGPPRVNTTHGGMPSVFPRGPPSSYPRADPVAVLGADGFGLSATQVLAGDDPPWHTWPEPLREFARVTRLDRPAIPSSPATAGNSLDESVRAALITTSDTPFGIHHEFVEVEDNEFERGS